MNFTSFSQILSGGKYPTKLIRHKLDPEKKAQGQALIESELLGWAWGAFLKEIKQKLAFVSLHYGEENKNTGHGTKVSTSIYKTILQAIADLCRQTGTVIFL